MLTNEEIRSQIEVGFTPYRCIAEVWDYNQKIRFRVFNSSDEPLLTVEEVILSSVRDSVSLESLLVSVRQRVEDVVGRSRYAEETAVLSSC